MTAGRVAAEAGQGYAPFHSGNDVRQGNILRTARQHVAAGYAANAFDNAAPLQQTHYLLNEFF